jgi:hypothetical protein
MTQEIFLWALIAGLVGFVWVMVLAGLDDDHDTQDTHDNRQGSASQEPHDGEKAHEDSSLQSKITA